jgi:choline dehydrogenase-like flavoprotein
MELNDYIVIGSGCCGAMVAKTLVDAKQRVLLLDAGVQPDSTIKSAYSNYIAIRQNDTEQQDFLIGQDMQAIRSIQSDHPVHLTPNRQFTIEKTEQYLSWIKGDFMPIESLAKGGLGNAWGLGSFVYSDEELINTGLPVSEMKSAYQWVNQIVGISGGDDDAKEYANGSLFKPQKAIPLDFNGMRLHRYYKKNKQKLLQLGFHIGRTPLAISTENEQNGDVFKGNDLDFYDIRKGSAFRPINLIEQLQKSNLLDYRDKQFVLSFNQQSTQTIVEAIDMQSHEQKKYACKKLIIATGALGTARIVMRSLNLEKLPLLCNPYTYIPSLQYPLIGAANTGYQTGLGQFSLYYDFDRKHKEIAMGSTYSYRALMGFRLMREFPFDYKSNIQWLKLLQPALNVTGLFHSDYGSATKYIERVFDNNSPSLDKLIGTYQLNDEEHQKIYKNEKAFKNALRKLGTIPLRAHRNQHGASIHYGGTLPFNGQYANASLHANGRLKAYENIFVADGSGFQFLSGKGLTLTLMAYAHLVAKNSLVN